MSLTSTARGLGLALGALLLATPASAQTKLLRFPDIHGDTVVFTYAGDLWTAPAKGGTAARLTAHPGQENFAKFSPDGKWVAFTGQYDGDEQVYVMPATGGVPKQLTYYPARGPMAPRHGLDNQVYGWTPDGTSIVFRSLRDADGGRSETALYTVPAGGGLAVKLPMPTSGAGDFAPDGKRLVYSPLFRDFRTWKRYEGGWAQDLYVYDLATHQAKPIGTSKRTERDPMWIGDRVYFASDRDGTLNLYTADVATGSVLQLTKSTTWDVRWASSDNKGRIVYELGGELRVMDVASQQDAAAPIVVPTDALAARPSRHPADKQVESFSLSPKGERALFVARGDVFTAPIEKGATRNLTNSSNAHDKHARWSPDGRRVAFVSDRTGEEQVYLVDQDGSGAPEQLTSQFAVQLQAPEWAPDGKRLAFSDKDGKLFVLTIADKKVVEVADDAFGGLGDYAWSPDGAFLAFSLGNFNGNNTLHVWSVADGQLRAITDPMWNAQSPAWDAEGQYLYYLSERDFAPQISNVEWNFAGNRSTGIFALALRKDGKHPFPPESDEVNAEKKDEAKPAADKAGDDKKATDKADKKEPEKKEAAKPVVIDWDGLGQRVARVPVPADNIIGLAAVKGHLLYVKNGAFFYGRDSYQKANLHIFDIKKREESELVPDVQGYTVSDDGQKVLVRQAAAYNLYDAKPKAKDKKTVSTKGLAVDRNPQQEWATIFDEVWRRFRDFFYVKNMHGYDWKAIGERYRSLLPHVAHRSDLDYILSEMVAELNVGHAYVERGDYELPARPKVGLPGARFALDEKAGRYRIAQIFRGHNEEEKYRSPLTEVGVDARVGDYVLAIDGDELKADDDPYRLLRHKTDPVTLTLNATPALAGARKVSYKPLASEDDLLYLGWVLGNKEKVDKATEGKVAYIHVPDMGAPGIAEFIKWYYGQIRKEGLIVDVRSNGGGNVSQWILERLDTKLLGTRFGMSGEFPGTYPGTVFHGPMVALINETSASDGDIFPNYFRKAGLGPLIGKRTWGGVVGISGRGPLLDGSQVFVPLNATNDENGNYIVEGIGVAPDIEVENDPAS
ncbi:MAG: S41 family peptidase, partial [Vicinamibacteria bacterium]|nr:S41 family peptidase [Vicinamibacteria bacterium]